MTSLKKFDSGLFCYEITTLSTFSFQGRGWFVTFERPSLLLKEIDDKSFKAIIHAKSSDTAQNARDLIIAASLLSGHLSHSPPIADEAIVEANIKVDRLIPGWSSAYWDGIPIDIAIAAKASFRLSHQYALHKYAVSKNSAGSDFYDLHPSYWSNSKNVSPITLLHVHYSNAIILAYSIIEELGLEIRASAKDPSYLQDGNWNPTVRNNLEIRLKNAKIALDKQVVWYRRSTPNQIERVLRPLKGDKAEWSEGNIRDIKVDICDAISYASGIRSKASAHRLSKLAKSLTSIDVANVQELARYLLLSKLGFWGKLQ